MRLTALTTVLAVAPLCAAWAEDQPAINCADPQTTQEINGCAADDFDKADALMNAVYQKALASQIKLDKDFAADSPEYVGAAKALKKAQRAWIAFRDANCESKVAIDAGGTLQTSELITCQKEMTSARTRELKTLINGDE